MEHRLFKVLSILPIMSSFVWVKLVKKNVLNLSDFEYVHAPAPISLGCEVVEPCSLIFDGMHINSKGFVQHCRRYS